MLKFLECPLCQATNTTSQKQTMIETKELIFLPVGRDSSSKNVCTRNGWKRECCGKSVTHVRAVVAVAFSSHARIWGEGSATHSLPALFFPSSSSFLKWRSALAHQFYSLGLVTPQSLSELRRLWPSVTWRVTCEFVSMIGFFIPGQHSLPTPTLLGQGCVRVWV